MHAPNQNILVQKSYNNKLAIFKALKKEVNWYHAQVRKLRFTNFIFPEQLKINIMVVGLVHFVKKGENELFNFYILLSQHQPCLAHKV